MNKDQFNELSIDAQFNHLNELLSTDKSKTRASIFKEIGIPKTTVGDRAKAHGYIFNTESNQYEHIDLDSTDNISRILPNKPSAVLNNSYPSNIQKDNLALTNAQKKNLYFLLNNIDKLKSIIEGKPIEYENHNLSNLVDDIYTFKKQPRDYKVKSLRIDNSVLKEFDSIALVLSDRGIKQQELLSFIIHNFVQSFNSSEQHPTY